MKFDITKRLREPPFGTETSERLLMAQAADEIDTLRAENERLRAALEPFFKASEGLNEAIRDSFLIWVREVRRGQMAQITAADLRRVRAALSEDAQ